MSNIQIITLQIITAILWLAAGAVYIIHIFQYPKEHRYERFMYAAPIISFIVHVVLFYVFIVIYNFGDLPELPELFFRQWSAILRLHGGLALGIKELVAWYRYKISNEH